MATSGMPRSSRSRTDEVALLDREGVIVAVNAAWDEFCVTNGGDPRHCGPGTSYLAVCAADAADPASADVATAIEAALTGDLPAPRRVLVPCHSPSEPRWFDLLVSSRLDDSGTCIGATVTLSAVHPGIVADRIPPAGVARDAAAFGIDGLLIELARRDEDALDIFVQYWLGPAIDHDDEHDGHLVETVTALLDTGDAGDAAALLGIPVAEVHCRQNRLQQLCGVTLADPETRLALHVALRGWRVLTSEV